VNADVDHQVRPPTRLRRVLLAGAVLLLVRGTVGVIGWLYLVASAERLKAELGLALGSPRDSEFPVLGGCAQACNAAERYAQALAELARSREPADLTPGQANQTMQAASTQLLMRLQEDARCCTVCDWSPDARIVSAEDETLLLEGVRLVSLDLPRDDGLVGTGSDEVSGVLLEALRFSSCMATGPPGVRVHGERLFGEAVQSLIRLVAEGRAKRESLEHLAAHLDALEGRLPSVEENVRVTALELALQLATVYRERGGRGPLDGWLPLHATAAYRFRRDQALIREMVDVVDACELDALWRVSESIGLRARSLGSEWLSNGLPPFYTWRVVHECLIGRYRLLRATVTLELIRLRTGSYPDDLPTGALNAGSCSVLQDLRYKRTDSGYTLACPGLPALPETGGGTACAVVLQVPSTKDRPDP
jgi:hypothetical protein